MENVISSEIIALDINSAYKSACEGKLEFLARKAKKAGLSFSWAWGKGFWKEVTHEIVHKEAGYVEEKQAKVFCIPLQVTGQFHIALPGGWKLVGALQVIDGITLYNGNVPDSVRANPNHCEHCQVKRSRSNVYVLENGVGKIIAVGSSCIRDFLGRDIDQAIVGLSIWEAIITIDRSGGFDEYESSGGHSGVYDLQRIVAMTFAIMRDRGYVSRAKSDETGKDTTAMVLTLALNGGEKPEVTESDKEKADKAIEFAESFTDAEAQESTYIHNVREIARNNYATNKLLGLACSIARIYELDCQKKAEAIAKAAGYQSQWVGEIGKRAQFFGKCVGVTSPFESGLQFTRWVRWYTFRDEVGNIMKTKTDGIVLMIEGERVEVSAPMPDVEFKIVGTPKEHSEWKGDKQTQLSRCVVTVATESDKLPAKPKRTRKVKVPTIAEMQETLAAMEADPAKREIVAKMTDIAQRFAK